MAEDVLILNFQGEDGATIWVEEAQGLEPSDMVGCELDTDYHQFGVSSLRLVAETGRTAWFSYVVPGIGDEFTYTGYFRFPDVTDLDIKFGICAYDGDSFFGFGLYKWEGDFYLFVRSYDSKGNFIGLYVEINTLTADTFHEFELSVSGRDVIFKIDEGEIVSWEAKIDAPLHGLDYVEFDNDSDEGNDLWLASIVLNTEPPTPKDRYWVGDSGNFSDTGHWSETSGGVGGVSVPEFLDNVILDENSFTLAEESIYIDDSYTVGSFTANLDKSVYLFFEELSTFTTDSFNIETSSVAYLLADTWYGDPWYISVPSGIVSVENTTIEKSHASGGAEFQAYTINGNVDGGGNTGWIFDAPALDTEEKALLKIRPESIGHIAVGDNDAPQFWFPWGNHVVIEPIPDDEYPLKLFVSDYPTSEMILTTDSPDSLPDEFQPCIVDFACWVLSMKLKKWNQAGRFYNRYIAGLTRRRKEYMERKADRRAARSIPGKVICLPPPKYIMQQKGIDLKSVTGRRA